MPSDDVQKRSWIFHAPQLNNSAKTWAVFIQVAEKHPTGEAVRPDDLAELAETVAETVAETAARDDGSEAPGADGGATDGGVEQPLQGRADTRGGGQELRVAAGLAPPRAPTRGQGESLCKVATLPTFVCS